jgi:hypothetical protein
MEDKNVFVPKRTVTRKAVYNICKRVPCNYKLISYSGFILDSKKDDNNNIQQHIYIIQQHMYICMKLMY